MANGKANSLAPGTPILVQALVSKEKDSSSSSLQRDYGFQHVENPLVPAVIAGEVANQDAGEGGGGIERNEEEEPLRVRMGMRRRR